MRRAQRLALKQTYVLGVAAGTSVRLADGTRLRGAAVAAGLAKVKSGSIVKVVLRFRGGKMQIGGITVPAVPAVWHPTSAAPLTLHWVLDNPLNLSDPVQMGLRSMSGETLPAPDVYDIDGFVNSAATVAALHAMGKKVICYMDAGAYETYRPDVAAFRALSPRIWGAADAGWAGSYWLDIRRISDLEPIMKARFQICKDKGFDAIEPDEITGWSNPSGFPLTYADQIAYNRAVAGWAHAIGMSIGPQGRPGAGARPRQHVRLDAQRAVLRVQRMQPGEQPGTRSGRQGLGGLQLFAREQGRLGG